MPPKFRLGADPEIFLLDRATETLVSALGKIGGNKAFPLQIEHLPKGFTLQEDNVALEFGIPPARTRAAFVRNIDTVVKAAQAKLPAITFSSLSCVKFPKSELMHPLAHEFGCEPDYCAWTKEKNDKPHAFDETLRSAGGHVHIETNLDPNEVGKALDLFLAIPAILMDPLGKQRQQLYGKAGAIRYKPYGLEYRVLSNFWIQKTKHVRWVWDSTAKALEYVQAGEQVPDSVPVIVNNWELDLAIYFCKEYKLNVC